RRKIRGSPRSLARRERSAAAPWRREGKGRPGRRVAWCCRPGSNPGLIFVTRLPPGSAKAPPAEPAPAPRLERLRQGSPPADQDSPRSNQIRLWARNNDGDNDDGSGGRRAPPVPVLSAVAQLRDCPAP